MRPKKTVLGESILNIAGLAAFYRGLPNDIVAKAEQILLKVNNRIRITGYSREICHAYMTGISFVKNPRLVLLGPQSSIINRQSSIQ